jgi:hypothetical protein
LLSLSATSLCCFVVSIMTKCLTYCNCVENTLNAFAHQKRKWNVEFLKVWKAISKDFIFIIKVMKEKWKISFSLIPHSFVVCCRGIFYGRDLKIRWDWKIAKNYNFSSSWLYLFHLLFICAVVNCANVFAYWLFYPFPFVEQFCFMNKQQKAKWKKQSLSLFNHNHKRRSNKCHC